MPYLSGLMRRSGRLFLTLVKVMLPVMIAVQAAQAWGWIDILGQAFAPAMGLLNLPAEAGMVWMTGAFVGIYGAIAALISLAPVLELTGGQFSALCSMLLFAHALPVEQAIVRRAGASFWATAALRVGAALGYGAAVSWFCHATGWLDEPVSLQWLQSTALAGEQAGGIWAWVRGTAVSLSFTYLIILALLVALDVMERTGITRAITVALTPVLRVSGLDPRVTPVTILGVLLGLSYGGALIIEEAEKQQLEARPRFLALAWLSLSHSLIEDTVLLMALGANGWIVLVGRLLVTLVVVAILARMLGGGGAARRPLGAPAG
ncbi:hypothetical protein [Bordetella bronchiseptica]|uniref:hypothetical protein n=1 Tax=Bordetella bronchiseptica TaxID=518 RepID=UPI00389A7148